MVNEKIQTVDELLLQREAKGLRIPIIVRILFITFGVISAITVPLPNHSLFIILPISIITISLNVYFLFLLKDIKKVRWIGLTSVFFDCLAVLSYPFILYNAISEPSQPFAIVSIMPLLVAVCMIFIVIASLGLRPIYPILVTVAAIIGQLLMIIFSLNHPSVTWTDQAALVTKESPVSLSGIVNAILFLIIVGSALAWLMKGVRKTIIQAAELQAERFQIVRKQANLLIESRIGALGELVAGISHEMNSPLGAVKANANTWQRAVKRFKDSLYRIAESGSVDPKSEDILNILDQNSRQTLAAADRMESILGTLRNFARLDEAEFKSVNVHDALESSLALIPPEKIGTSKIVKKYQNIPTIKAYAGRLNQVFMILLTRAFDSVNSNGTITIHTEFSEDNLIIKITDSGPALSPVQIEQLFDIRMEAKTSRVQASFGLAACQSIVNQHHGQLSVESHSEQGTTFIIRIPARTI